MNPYESDSPSRGVTPSHGLPEPSTGQSEYLSDEGFDPAPAGAKTYTFYYTKRHTNLQVHDEEGTCVYFADVSQCTPNTPDVALHAGGDNTGRVLAVARFRFTRAVIMGLGNPENEREMIWEEMKNQDSLLHSKYRFEMSIKNERRALVWQRTRSKEDGATKFSFRNYKLLDEEIGQVLALYLESGWTHWQEKGQLEIRANLGQGWEVLVILSSVSLCEKASRRAREKRLF